MYVEDPYIIEMKKKHMEALKKIYDIACSQHCCEHETHCPAFLYKQKNGIGRDGIKMTWRCEYCVKTYKMDIIGCEKYLMASNNLIHYQRSKQYLNSNLEKYLDCIVVDNIHCGDQISGYHGM